MDSSITAFKVRAQLAGFLGIFSTRFSKPIQRFIGQMLFGIQAAQDVKLSQIGRELQEPIRIARMHTGPRRTLNSPGHVDYHRFDRHSEAVRPKDGLLGQGTGR